MKSKTTKNIIKIKNIMPFYCKLKFLIIFVAMKTERLYIWSWCSPKNQAVNKAVI